MRRRRSQDLRAVLACLRRSYAPQDLATFPRHVLNGLKQVVAADWVWYNDARPAKGRIEWVIDPLDTFPGAEQVFAECMHEHPYLLDSARISSGRTWRLSDALPRGRLHRLRIYNEFYRRRGIEYQLGIKLSASRSNVIAVGVNRGPRQHDFSDDDMLCLNLLGPHFVEAYRNAEALTGLRAELAGVARVEETGRAIVMLRDSDVEWVSPGARRLLERHTERSPRGSRRLPEAITEWLSCHRGAFAGDDVPLPRGALVITRGADQLRVRRLADGRRTFLLLDERPRDLIPADLARLGLTRRESEVLTWVARGKTNEDTAIILAARPSTIAKHLERIFRKLGVETRTAAAARAFEAAAAVDAQSVS